MYRAPNSVYTNIVILKRKHSPTMPHFKSNCKFDSGLLANSELDAASQALKAISHPLRLQILCQIGLDESSVQDIVEAVGTSQSNISQHLGVMRDKGVLTTRKQANHVYYRIGHDAILRLVNEKSSQQASAAR